MESLLELIQEYGVWVYVLLFAYCALKSGAMPLFAGYAAQAGALELVPVAAAAFAGGYLGDEARFTVARRYGDAWANKWPRVQRAIATAKALVARYGWAYIFLYRYPKGMRTVGALPIGLGAMPWGTFTILNAASAAVWTSALVAVGYAFGVQVENAVKTGWGAASLFLLVLMVIGIFYAWRRINQIPTVETTAR